MSKNPVVVPVSRKALVLYGSETGNAQDVAGDVRRLIRRLHFQTVILEFDHVAISDLLKFSIVIFVISTTGQGELPQDSRVFWKKLKSARLPSGCLSTLQFASFGLGDSSYPQFNWAHRKLYNRIVFLGAQSIYQKGESDAQHPEGTDASLLPWLTGLKKAVLARYPLAEGQEQIPEHTFLAPELELTEVENYDEVVKCHLTNGNKFDSKEPAHAPWLASAAPGPPLQVTLQKVERLTPEKHWQDVRLFEFTTPSKHYNPGDIVSILPKNSSEDVNCFLKHFGWESIANRFFRFRKTTKSAEYDKLAFTSHQLTSENTMTLRQILTDVVDFTAIPRRSFFAMIAHFTDDEAQKERLLEFTDSEYIDELFDYTTRPRRSILEVLQEFDTVRIPLQWITSVIPSIRARQFSIASGGSLQKSEKGQSRFELLIAIVKYKTVIRKIREGICTKYLANLPEGSVLNVAITAGGIRLFPTRPAIMVGPGTGVAPLRSIIHDRYMRNEQEPDKAPPTLLLYGGRNKDCDYFFANEWDLLEQRLNFDVLTAFSRDQPQKIYVQDIIRKYPSRISRLIEDGAVVYICGSSGKMPQAVREAFVEVLSTGLKLEHAAAEKRFKELEKAGLYQQETW